ncbi:MAG: cupin domain-containing protein [Candidatus Peribacteraceae bacterium]|nr:cupin domain-containing protein [Candidatus Peribacteraceae bacterium]
MKRPPLFVLIGILLVAAAGLGYWGGISDQRPAPVTAPVGNESLVVPFETAKVYDIPGGKCTLYDSCPTNRLSVATIVQDGRYPEEGQRVNARCTEAILVLEGELTVTLDEKPVILKPGDLVYITPKTPYSVEGKGKAVVMIEPKWDKTQNTPAPAK